MSIDRSFPVDRRPCGVTDRDGDNCAELVEAAPGYRTCPQGHLSLGISLHRVDTAYLTARALWLAYDASADRTTQYLALHRPDGGVDLRSRERRPQPDLKYGLELLEERPIVLTKYAAKKMAEDRLDLADLRAVLVDGQLFQNQPGKFRYRGYDCDGRAIHVTFRLNLNHEIVVIAAFEEKVEEANASEGEQEFASLAAALAGAA